MSRIAGIITLSSLSLLALTLSSRPALAQGWSRSFDTPNLRSYHRSQVEGVIVVGAGTPGEPLSDAVASLKNAYTLQKITPLVMDDQALGTVTDLGDAQIVKKAQHLPVSHVVIVRVFDGQPATAVVSVYDKWGSAVATFAVKEGGLLAPSAKNKGGGFPAPAPPPAPIASVSAAGVPGDQGAAEPLDPQTSAARDRYLGEYVWFEPGKVRKGKLLDWDQDSVAFLGANKKKKLSGKSFYTAMGRKDLAARYSSRNKVRWTFILGGIAVTGGGAALAFGLREDCSGFVDNTMERIDCDDGNSRKLMAGGIVAGAGFLTWLVGWYLINPHPVSSKEAQGLADRYNEGLRRDVGLPSGYDDAAPPPADPPKTSWRIDPSIGMGGGGLVLTGTF